MLGGVVWRQLSSSRQGWSHHAVMGTPVHLCSSEQGDSVLAIQVHSRGERFAWGERALNSWGPDTEPCVCAWWRISGMNEGGFAEPDSSLHQPRGC